MTTAIAILLVLAAILAAAEIYARFVLGLGDPPLWQADPEVEYLPLPSRSYRRFGNRVSYNQWSMRSRDFPREKSSADELRVLVLGDSLVNGGVHVDQDALATSLLERWLSERLVRPVVVGNVSAGSWGPPNYLAYIRRHGLFDADVVVVVVNSTDYRDAPTFGPLGLGRPTRKPTLAIEELWTKYLPRVQRRMKRRRHERRHGPTEPRPEDIELCLNALREIIDRAREAGAAIVVAQHLKLTELRDGPEVGHGEILRVCREAGVEPLQLGDAFRASVGAGERPYFDYIHPTARGQEIMAERLLPAILEQGTRSGATAPEPRREGT